MSTANFQRSIAIIVGINDYQNGIPILKTPVRDAQALAEILQTQHGYRTFLLLNQQANRKTIRAILEDSLSERVEENDRILFYFAGHGIALNGEEGPEGYLIPQDARLGDASTYLPMSQVYQALLQLPCRHFLGILDCCFAGAFRWSSTRKLIPIDSDIIHKERFDRFIQDPAWQVITSTSHDQYAWDALTIKDDRGLDPNHKNHSPFAAALIEALSGKADTFPPAKLNQLAGDGLITATELYLYLRNYVEDVTEDRGRQTPGLWPLKKHDKGEYIFFAPGHPLNLPNAPSLEEVLKDEAKNPYRGLQSYEKEHSHLFFGRTRLIETLCDAVSDRPFTVVLGASGSGKSSLVKAGLIPHLEPSEQPFPQQRHQPKLESNAHPHQHKHSQWQIVPPFRPGETPLKALYNALKDGNSPLARWLLDGAELTPQLLITAINAWSRQCSDSKSKLLLVIDQFEELVTLCRHEQARSRFLQILIDSLAAYPERFKIVLTLRSDFEPQLREGVEIALQQHPLLLSLVQPQLGNQQNHEQKREALSDQQGVEQKSQLFWNQARFIVPAMSREELREVIEEPASAKVVFFKPHALVDQLIDEVTGMPGALPLLSFALSELYLKLARRYFEARQAGSIPERSITQEDYSELGGVARSLTQRADQEYGTLVKQDPAFEQTIKHVMLRMIAVSGGELTRRRVLLSELVFPEPENTRVKEVIQRFSAARLLISGTDVEDRPYVEPAHDALVRGWQQLQIWKDQELANLLLQRELAPSADRWVSERKNKQAIGLLWDDDPRLPLLKQVLESKQNWLNIQEIEFVQRSLQRRRNNRHRLIGTTAGVMASLVGLSIFALIQLQYSLLREKAAAVRNELAAEPLNSLLLAIQATGESATRLSQVLSPVQFSLSSAVAESREQIVIRGHEGAVLSVAFSPDGQMIVSGGEDGTVRLWDLTGRPIAVLGRHEEKSWEKGTSGKQVNSVAFSPKGQWIVSGGTDGTVRLWDLQGNQVSIPKQHQGPVTSVAFDPTGQFIVSGSQNGEIWLWNPQSASTKLLPIPSDLRAQPVPALAFSPDNQTIAGIVGDQIILWSLSGELLSNTHDGDRTNHAPCSVSFSPDGKRIFIGQCRLGGTLSVTQYNVQMRYVSSLRQKDSISEQEDFSGHTGEVKSLVSSPDGIVASGSDDGTIRLWQTTEARDSSIVPVLRGHTGGVNAVALSFSGNQLVSASSDGTIRIWDLKPTLNIFRIKLDEVKYKGSPLQTDIGSYSYQIRDFAFSPDGKAFIVAIGKAVILLDLEGNLIAAPFQGHNDLVTSVAFSPDGKTIISGSDDRTLRLWNLQGQALAVFNGYKGPVTSIAFSPDGKAIVSVSGDGNNASDSSDRTLRLWDLKGNTLAIFKQPEDSKPSAALGASIPTVAFSPDGKTIISSDNKILRLWDLQGNILAVFKGHEKRINSVAFSPDGKLIISGGDDKTIRLWNLKGEPTGIRVIRGHAGTVQAVRFSADGNTIISAESDRTINFWSLDGSPAAPSFTNRSQGYETSSTAASLLAISPDGKTILTSMFEAKEVVSPLVLIKGWEWQDWLRTACDRLRHHPALENPQTDIQRGAKDTCQNYIWQEQR